MMLEEQAQLLKSMDGWIHAHWHLQFGTTWS